MSLLRKALDYAHGRNIYNIEGLNHSGIGWQLRRKNTDFGSGWIGETIKSLGHISIGAAVGAGIAGISAKKGDRSSAMLRGGILGAAGMGIVGLGHISIPTLAKISGKTGKAARAAFTPAYLSAETATWIGKNVFKPAFKTLKNPLAAYKSGEILPYMATAFAGYTAYEGAKIFSDVGQEDYGTAAATLGTFLLSKYVYMGAHYGVKAIPALKKGIDFFKDFPELAVMGQRYFKSPLNYLPFAVGGVAGSARESALGISAWVNKGITFEKSMDKGRLALTGSIVAKKIAHNKFYGNVISKYIPTVQEFLGTNIGNILTKPSKLTGSKNKLFQTIGLSSATLFNPVGEFLMVGGKTANIRGLTNIAAQRGITKSLPLNSLRARKILAETSEISKMKLTNKALSSLKRDLKVEFSNPLFNQEFEKNREFLGDRAAEYEELLKSIKTIDLDEITKKIHDIKIWASDTNKVKKDINKAVDDFAKSVAKDELQNKTKKFLEDFANREDKGVQNKVIKKMAKYYLNKPKKIKKWTGVDPNEYIKKLARKRLGKNPEDVAKENGAVKDALGLGKKWFG